MLLKQGYRFLDSDPLLDLAVAAQTWYRAKGLTTKVLPASLISTTEIMALSGVDHITVAPRLLRELATMDASTVQVTSLFGSKAEEVISEDFQGLADDEVKFRLAVTREHGGDEERKLSQAINIFCDFQEKLQVMMVKRGVNSR